jgi:hypothetical protein
LHEQTLIATMKVVNFFLYLAAVSSAVVVADEQALLGHGKKNDDRLNAIDERLLPVDEAGQADGMYSFRVHVFSFGYLARRG